MPIIRNNGEEHFYEYQVRTGRFPNIGWIVPYFYRNKWYITDERIHVPLTEVARRCKIDQETVIMLRLKYGG
jgi:hypothetical protein